MYSWITKDKYRFIPLFIECIAYHKTESGFIQLDRGHLPETIVRKICDKCGTPGRPLIVDMNDIDAISRVAFTHFTKNTSLNRDIYFIDVSESVKDRIFDDTGDLFTSTEITTSRGKKWILSHSSNDTPIEEISKLKVESIYSDKIFEIISSAVVEYSKKIQPSTPVHSDKYFDAKTIFYNPLHFQLIVYELSKKIKYEFAEEYDVLVSASRNGAFLATPIASLLNTPTHCWVNLGPQYIPRNTLDWPMGKNKKCLLIADMVSMGTEMKVVQAALANKKSRVVGCAAIAKYISPKQKHIHLIDRNDLKKLGYKLFIPNEIGTSNA